MALKYELGEVLLSGRDLPLTHEAVFIPLRPGAAFQHLLALPELTTLKTSPICSIISALLRIDGSYFLKDSLLSS